MGWTDAIRLSRVAFTEVALQATYALRQGNPVPPGTGRALVERAGRRVRQSKLLIAGLLALLVLGSASLLRESVRGYELIVPFPLPVGLYQAGILTGLLGLEVALLWWTGLQALPTLLTSSAVTVLETLPVDRRTLREAAVLVYLRLFDTPAAVVVVLTPLGVGLALGPLAGLATLLPAVSAVAFALSLSLLTGRFFVRRVQGARGGGGGAAVRWAYLVLWLLPAFGLLAFVTASPPFFRAIAALAAPSPTPAVEALALAYPFALALWPPLAAGGPLALHVPPVVPALSIGAGVGYVVLTVYASVWLYASVAEVGVVPPTATAPGTRSPLELRPQAPMWAVLTKDLRLASRTPGYAFLILLPLLDAVALGLVTYAGSAPPSAAQGIAFGAVSAAALLATFFGPAFFALEVVAQSYGRTLPLAPRTMALGKVTLVGAIYLAAGGIVLAITAARVPAPGLFVVFVLAELPAVLAASWLELAILFRWARARGLAVTNLYSGTWNILLVSLPGVLLAGAPLVLWLARGFAPMAVASVAELVLVGAVALRRGAN